MGARDLENMEKERNEKVKEVFLAGYVVLGVALILVLWSRAFIERDTQTPYFYREQPGLMESSAETPSFTIQPVVPGTETLSPEPHATQTPVQPPPAPTLFITPDDDQ